MNKKEIMISKYRSFLQFAIPIIIALAISVIVSKEVPLTLQSHPGDVAIFSSFSQGLDEYKEIRQEWRPRILSNYLAGRLFHFVEVQYNIQDQASVMNYVFAYWTFAWLLPTFFIFIFLFKAKSLLYLFGILAGISFAYVPFIGITRIYPWDMPSLFIFACFIAILKAKRESWLVFFIPIAILFKETALLMIAAYFFWEEVPLRRRLIYVGITLLTSLVIKAGIDIITANPSFIFTMTYSTKSGSSRIIENIRQLLVLRLDSPIFIDAGLLVALLLLPIGKRPLLMLKLIAIAFILGNFVFGQIFEYRIWFEMIPISLYALDVYFFSSDTSLPVSQET